MRICHLLLSSIFLTALSNSSAMAMGSQQARIADQALVGLKKVVPDCEGRILESYWDDSGGYGYNEDLVLGCLRPDKSARWLLIAGLSCHDSRTSGRCAAKPRRPPLQAATPSKAPYRNKYTLKRYALGYDCRVLSQKVTLSDGSSSIEDSWTCDRIDLFDGARQSKPIVIGVETVGPKALSEQFEEFDIDWLPRRFVISRNQWEISVGDALE